MTLEGHIATVNIMQYTMAREKTAAINIRVDTSLKDAAERAAKDDHRTLTSLIEKLLSDHLRAGGYLPIDGKPPGKRK